MLLRWCRERALSRADLMLVGEQPGDKEISPASRWLGRRAEFSIRRCETLALREKPSSLPLKHFKHEMRGKRRLHKRPNNYEIERCKIWLDFERRLVKPVTIVALGVSAARSLTGRTITIGKVRGKPLALADGTRLVVTVHPSALLRMEDEDKRHAAYRNFVADLRVAAAKGSRGPQQRGTAGSRPFRLVLLRRFTRARCGSGHASLRERRADLLHAVDQICRGGRRQDEAAGWIAAAGDRRIGFDLIDTRDREFDPQRLAVKYETADRVSKRLRDIRAIHIPDRRGLPFPL